MYELRYEVLLRYTDLLIDGALLAIGISLASIILGAILGMLVALARTSNVAALIVPSKGCVLSWSACAASTSSRVPSSQCLFMRRPTCQRSSVLA